MGRDEQHVGIAVELGPVERPLRERKLGVAEVELAALDERQELAAQVALEHLHGDPRVLLLEAPNLLTMVGRKAARPEDRSRNPQVENEPEEVQKLINADGANFIRRARRLHDAAALAIQAVDAKDKDRLLRAIDNIDKACESCHLHYWYPNDKRAQEAAKEDGITD